MLQVELPRLMKFTHTKSDTIAYSNYTSAASDKIYRPYIITISHNQTHA